MTVSAIVFIFFAVCMVLGPIFLLQPSKRQKRIASIRLAAARIGVTVRLHRINDDPIAVYSIPWPAESKRMFSGPDTVILKKEYQHELHLLGIWEVKPAGNKREAFTAVLVKLLDGLPESVKGVELTAGGVGLYWAESGSEETLMRLKSHIEHYMPSLWVEASKPRVT